MSELVGDGFIGGVGLEHFFLPQHDFVLIGGNLLVGVVGDEFDAFLGLPLRPSVFVQELV